MIKDFIKNNSLIIFLSLLCVFSLSIAFYKYANNKKISSMLNDMYFIETTETKERYFLLEIQTNALYNFDFDDENVKTALLHFKNGDVANILINPNKNIFYLDDAPNKKLQDRTYKYNKTVYKMENEKEIKDDMNDVVKLDLEK
ncbi:MAG: hypothetical protein MJ244_04725 [Clostridia bacterium]|nr:hypothetical protein [Clostridia bacterium]